MSKSPGFGIRVEVKVVSILDGRNVRRLPIQWSKKGVMGTEIKLMGIELEKLEIDTAIFKDLPTTILVEPTLDELNFRAKSGAVLPTNSERYILFVCVNPKCTFKRVFQVFFNTRFHTWQISNSGDIESKCPKCQETLYSCGKSIIEPRYSYEGLKRCQCIAHFDSLGQKVIIPDIPEN